MADLGMRVEGADLVSLRRWYRSSRVAASMISPMRCGR
jgi:hypothetical protein